MLFRSVQLDECLLHLVGIARLQQGFLLRQRTHRAPRLEGLEQPPRESITVDFSARILRQLCPSYRRTTSRFLPWTLVGERVPSRPRGKRDPTYSTNSATSRSEERRV